MTYLELLKKRKVIPNFWCSEEYFKFAGWEESSFKRKGVPDTIFVWEEDDVMLPPMSLSNKDYGFMLSNSIWAAFPYWSYFDGTSEFLDYNYIYDPKHFLNMKGKKWNTFRKNSRKWPERNEGNWSVRYVSGMGTSERLWYQSHLEELMVFWLEARGETEEIHDHEIMMKFIFEGENRTFFFNKGWIVGVNVWDENYRYINFRYCMSDPREPFLNEFMRLHFYTSGEIVTSGKCVNDGGVLGNPELERFKDKLNPATKLKINTWRTK